MCPSRAFSRTSPCSHWPPGRQCACASLSAALADVAAIGLEALELASFHLAAPAGWLEPRLARLEAARAPVGEAELMAVDPVVSLACLAAGAEGAAAEGCRPRAGAEAAGDH